MLSKLIQYISGSIQNSIVKISVEFVRILPQVEHENGEKRSHDLEEREWVGATDIKRAPSPLIEPIRTQTYFHRFSTHITSIHAHNRTEAIRWKAAQMVVQLVQRSRFKNVH